MNSKPSPPKSNEFQSKSINLLRLVTKRHDLIFWTAPLVHFEAKGGEGKNEEFSSFSSLHIHPPPPPLCTRRDYRNMLTDVQCPAAYSTAEQNRCNTRVILILSAHISQTRVSWLVHNGCRADGVTGGIYNNVANCALPRIARDLHKHCHVCVYGDKLISRSRGFAIIFA